MSDRTGGHRNGVFGQALGKINQLHPEFVMSVGDLIEGYTKDTSLLNEHWKEFHGILDTLETKFFYVPGNHDYSNPTMATQWKERFGKDYYHFIYKKVLFLVANSNDGDGMLMSNDQIEYLKNVIRENSEVRWTMLFLHHPMWTYGKLNGFNEIEKVLQGRGYTVFAGHTHRYLHEVRNDQNHYVLGTTGGGSKLRGPRFGEFDHVSWVTMTETGPKLVNLELSGIVDHNVSNTKTTKDALALLQSVDFKPLTLSNGDERKVILPLKNTSNKIIRFKGKLFHHHQVTPNASTFDVQIPPNSSQQHEIITHPTKMGESTEWNPLELQWTMECISDTSKDSFNLSGTEMLELNPTTLSPYLSMTEQNIFIQDLSVTVDHPYSKKDIVVRYSLGKIAPTATHPVLSGYLELKNTNTLQVVLADNDGFLSRVLSKKYTKAMPHKPKKPRHPKRGLLYLYYEGNFTSVPNFGKLGNPLKTGEANQLNPDKIGNRLDHFAIQYKGYIKVPETSIYTFHLTSDDGSKFYIDDNLVVDNDGSHDITAKKGYAALKKGWHPIRIDYFEDFLGEHLQLEFSSPKMEKSPVEFWH
ncbi:MAG: PA14 domain-containing protein [Flavobacteriaceae bacterium]